MARLQPDRAALEAQLGVCREKVRHRVNQYSGLRYPVVYDSLRALFQYFWLVHFISVLITLPKITLVI